MIWVFQNASWVKCRNLTAEVLSLPAWKWTSGFLVNVYNLIRPTPLCLWLKIIVYEEKNPRTLRVWKLCAPEPQKVFNKFGWCCCRTDDGLARIPLYRKMDDFQFLQPAVTLVQISFTVDFFQRSLVCGQLCTSHFVKELLESLSRWDVLSSWNTAFLHTDFFIS